MGNTKKRIWLITGISSGLGKALARAVMHNGDFVVGTFRQADEVEAFSLHHKGRGCGMLLDITAEEEIEKCVTAAIKQFNRIDVLVNNAGVGFAGAIEETSTTEAKQVFAANFFGTLKMTQAVLPYMRQRREGHIIQISSHAGIKAFAGFGIYNASKFALEGFSEALAQEVLPLGIKVSLVEPGPFRTGFAGSRLGRAQRKIVDYEQTAGAFWNKLKAVDGQQKGDPDKAAVAIMTLTEAATPAFRLPLGKTALTTIGMKIDSLKHDIEINRQVASRADFT